MIHNHRYCRCHEKGLHPSSQRSGQQLESLQIGFVRTVEGFDVQERYSPRDPDRSECSKAMQHTSTLKRLKSALSHSVRPAMLKATIHSSC